jgi:hypothetical protein
MNRQLKPNIMASMKTTPSAYSVTVALLIGASVVAATLEPPTAYLVPLAVTAWAVAWWGYRRESKPRYKRDR